MTSAQPLEVDKNDERVHVDLTDSNAECKGAILCQRWRTFKEETTLHGVKFATTCTDGTYRLRWLVWTLAFLISLNGFLFTFGGIYSDFMNRRTITNTAIYQVEELPFPAVTICPLSPYKKSKLNLTAEMENFYLLNSRIGRYATFVEINYSNPVFQEPGNETYLNGASFSFSDVFNLCQFDNKPVRCDEMFNRKMTQMGQCFSMNDFNHVMKYGRRKTRRTGSLSSLALYLMIDQDEYVYSKSISAGFKVGVQFLSISPESKVTIHDPNEEPDVMNSAFLIAPGFSVNAAIKMKKFKYLPTPYKAFGEKYCMERRHTNFKNPLKYFPTYSEYGCIRECRRDYIVSLCGCRSHFDPGDELICSPEKNAKCYENHAAFFDGNASVQSACDCRIPCQFDHFSAQISTALYPAKVYDSVARQLGFRYLRESYMELNIYFDSLSYMEIERRPEYTPERLLGLIGGQMGLFLGASLLTQLEVLEFLIILIVTFSYKILGQIYARLKR